MNTFNLSGVDSMRRMVESAHTGQNAPGTANGKDFSSILAGMTVDIAASQTNTEPQTVKDVKKEFYAYLDSLALSPGLSGVPISVNITDAAFEKMLADPKYKQQMKDLCKRDLCDPQWVNNAAMGLKPKAMVIKLDADVEHEYAAISYNSGSGQADKAADAGDSFWTRRAKRSKAAREDEAQRAREKQEFLAFLQERAWQKKSGLGGSLEGFAPTGGTGAASFFADIASGGGAFGA